MTREQLDAIRARVEAATPGPWEAGTAFCCPDMGWIDGPKRMVCPVHESAKRTHTLDANDAEFIASAREDVPALLAEVERLTADPLPAAAWVREVERAAFARGVAAMREAAVEWAWRNFVLGAMASVVVRDLRALPDPEDKS